MVGPQAPYDRGDVIHALVVRYDDQGPFFRHLVRHPEAVPRSQNMRTPHQAKIQQAYAFLVGVIAEEAEANPLYRMKDKQGQPEENQKEKGQRIRHYFLHTGTKIKNRLSEAVFIC